MLTNNQIKLANLSMLEFVAAKLGNICNEVVFLGGCTTAIFITDLGAPDVRYTLDVDCIVNVISLSQYYELENKLQKQGFKKSIANSILCRWNYNEIILDVMPSEPTILGFGNKWYQSAIQHAVTHAITPQINIRVVTAPYFLATKFEAFKTRGNMDFYASHDFEDILSVLDGRSKITQEMISADTLLKQYLQKSFSEILKIRSFHDALPGHLAPYGDLAENRRKFLLEKIDRFIHSN
jgi:hypothetical protein